MDMNTPGRLAPHRSWPDQAKAPAV